MKKETPAPQVPATPDALAQLTSQLREARQTLHNKDVEIANLTQQVANEHLRFLAERSGHRTDVLFGKAEVDARFAASDSNSKHLHACLSVTQSRNSRRCQVDPVFSCVFDCLVAGEHTGKFELDLSPLRGRASADADIREVQAILYIYGYDAEGLSTHAILGDNTNTKPLVKLTQWKDAHIMRSNPFGPHPQDWVVKEWKHTDNNWAESK